MKVKKVGIKITGQAYVECGRYYDEEFYINKDIIFWSGSSGVLHGRNLIMAKGEYEWAFQFHIPDKCPSSFKADYKINECTTAEAYIRYGCKVIFFGLQSDCLYLQLLFCKAYIDVPFGFSHEYSLPFKVTCHTLLSEFPDTPISETYQKQIGWWCCSKGNVECIINIPKRKFLVGESIPLNIDIYNGCTCSMKKVLIFGNTK